MFPSSQLSYSEHSVLICHKHTPTDRRSRRTHRAAFFALRSNMFFAHLQQIKFPSKWISSLAAFGGRATLFSLICILFPQTNDLLYSQLHVTLLSLSFSPHFASLSPARRAMESNYTVRKVYSDLLKSLECYLFCSLFVSPWESESWHPNETEWAPPAQRSILGVI